MTSSVGAVVAVAAAGAVVLVASAAAGAADVLVATTATVAVASSRSESSSLEPHALSNVRTTMRASVRLKDVRLNLWPRMVTPLSDSGSMRIE